MFLSADELKLAYGVDLRIGKVYVDRKVPVGNAYWEGRRLYMPPVTGFLFMPIFSDLCRRCGLPWRLSCLKHICVWQRGFWPVRPV